MREILRELSYNRFACTSALLLIFIFLSSTSHSASFNCQKSSTNVERMICADKKLSLLDQVMAAEYRFKLRESSDQEQLRLEQRDWRVSKRDKCTSMDCLERVYNEKLMSMVSDDLKRYMLSLGWTLKSENWKGSRFCAQFYVKERLRATFSLYCAGGAYDDVIVD
jgi:uncharacterized protein